MHCLIIEYHAVGDTWWQPLLSLWQMMDRIQDWFIHLLILPSPILQSPHRRVICTMIVWTVKINMSDHILHITL